MGDFKPRRPKGLRLKDTREGHGQIATKGAIVVVHYDCFLPRGDKLESSRDRPYPAQVVIGKRQVVPALEYGVPGMAEGGLRTITVSLQLAYYERRRDPSLSEGAALRYEVEFIRVSSEWDDSIYRTKDA